MMKCLTLLLRLYRTYGDFRTSNAIITLYYLLTIPSLKSLFLALNIKQTQVALTIITNKTQSFRSNYSKLGLKCELLSSVESYVYIWCKTRHWLSTCMNIQWIKKNKPDGTLPPDWLISTSAGSGWLFTDA